MNKKLVLALCLSSVVKLSAFADDAVHTKMQTTTPSEEISLDWGLKSGAERVEVYYLNTQNNRKVMNDIGVRGKVYLEQECAANTSKKCDRYSDNGPHNNGPHNAHYVRWGTLDVAGLINTSGRERSGEISHAKLAVYEMMSKDGWYVTLAEVSYLQDNNLKHVKFQIPFTLKTGANFHVNVVKGGAVQLFFQTEINGFLGGVKMENTYSNYTHTIDGKDGAPDIKERKTKNANGLFNPGVRFNGQAGIRLFNIVELGGFSQNELGGFVGGDIGAGYVSTTNGARLDVKLVNQDYLKVSLFGSASRTKFNSGDSFRDIETHGKIDEKYWQAGGGLRVEF